MKHVANRLVPYIAIALGLTLTGACSDDEEISSDEEARRAYLGLDDSIEKSLNLGFDGFNSASSANIAPQTTTGATAGTLTIVGQVDQGSSDNKGMRLNVGMVDYSDGPFVVIVDEEEVEVHLAYDTSAVVAEQPYLHLQLRNIPNGTFTGELTGIYHLEGDIEADVTLTLTMSGMIMEGTGGAVVRVPAMTHVTGTATSGDGLYTVDVQI